MAACGVCGSSNQFLFTCQHCGRRYCSEHQPVAEHACGAAPTKPHSTDNASVQSTTSDETPKTEISVERALDSTILDQLPSRDRLPTTLILLVVVFLVVVAGGFSFVLIQLGLIDDLSSSFDGVDGASGNGVEPNPSGSALNRTAIERMVVEELNEFREEQGVSRVNYDTELAAIAENHSDDMAERNYTGHVGPDGETVRDRFTSFGYDCDAPAELVLFTEFNRDIPTDEGTLRFETGAELADGIVTLWRLSDAHREAMLTTTWKHAGVGVVITPEDRVYVTLNAC